MFWLTVWTNRTRLRWASCSSFKVLSVCVNYHNNSSITQVWTCTSVASLDIYINIYICYETDSSKVWEAIAQTVSKWCLDDLTHVMWKVYGKIMAHCNMRSLKEKRQTLPVQPFWQPFDHKDLPTPSDPVKIINNSCTLVV